MTFNEFLDSARNLDPKQSSHGWFYDLPSDTLSIVSFLGDDGPWMYRTESLNGWTAPIESLEFCGPFHDIAAHLYFQFYVWECWPSEHDTHSLTAIYVDLCEYEGLPVESTDEILLRVTGDHDSPRRAFRLDVLKSLLDMWERVE